MRDYYIQRNAFPFLRGNVSGAVEIADGGFGTPYNYCNTLLLHWVTLAFQGWRGSIRYKMLPDTFVDIGNANDKITSKVYVERQDILPFGTDKYVTAQRLTPAYGLNTEASEEIIIGAGFNQDFTGTKGSMYTTSAINPNVEVEIPFYSRWRFCPGKEQNWTGNNFVRSPNFRAMFRNYTSAKSTIDYHVAAGEDFQVYFFTGLPRMYFENAPPAA
jgi:hypothetical protein